MRNEVYASYHEKFLKNTIIYASLDTNLLYFSKDMNPKDLVSKKELKNLFEKGLMIDDGRNLYKPVKLSKNPETNRIFTDYFQIPPKRNKGLPGSAVLKLKKRLFTFEKPRKIRKVLHANQIGRAHV